ncbi:MAG: LysM peptidoglycan-binding domain-containing protein [Chloroflexi bacterium]|nr:MAG: LysM peptidoglycan-binding domain-containing protein [Chloroflexota bacterium]
MIRHLLAKPLIIMMLLLFTTTTLGQSEVPPDDPNIIIHIVQRGENLFRIALNYGLTTEQVAQANNITDPGNIFVGQRLIIPFNELAIVQQPPETHIVQPGETLQRIADLYGLTIDTLIQLNGIENPNRIYVGQVLQISGEAVEPDFIETIHIVQSGESLSGIARQYGVALADIQQVNDIVNPSRIYVGQQLIIPGIHPTNTTAAELPDFVTSLNLRPLSFVEGQTGLIRLTTQTPANVTSSFLNRSQVVISQENNTVHLMFIPIPIFTEAGIYPIEITLTSSTGEIAQISFNIQVVSGGYGSQYITLPEDKVPLLAPGVEQNEMAILTTVTSSFTNERYYQGTMSLPAAAAMNAPYGTRRSYNGGAFDHYHNGADFAGAPGTPVYAAAPGQVVLADTLNIRGISVVIDHGWGVYTNYSHMAERYVNIGDFVQTGQPIGAVGNTGRATGAHLHWELWVNGIPVDPMQWVWQTFP